MLDLAIIGGGPAGLSAGLYATRGGLKNVVMFEMGEPGGQITSSSEIENYPGQKNPGESGFDFMSTWWGQCSHFGLIHKRAVVAQISQNTDKSFNIKLDNGEIETAKAVIVCTGSTPRRAGFEGEDKFFGRGVSTCATCDGFFYRNKEVAVLGGGDTAIEEAIYLSNIASKVYLIHRRDEFRAAPVTVEKAKNNEKIEFITPATIKEAYGDNAGLNGLILNTKDGERDLKVPGIFTFVGLNVNNAILKQDDGKFICEMDANENVKVDLKMKTSVPGLFAAGDIRTEAPKQVVSAAADGAVAALSALSYIENLH
ncbi:NAD(P)/FAD-dependent oxidoreductase [Campylobacter majalis]|uniref:NAD(P)/FAD-dependent oxidoreductase n=1 Tax=Campylobacter majalis TaxID=2790656 RepID=UPI003D683350